MFILKVFLEFIKFMDFQSLNHILEPKYSYALAIVVEVKQNIHMANAPHVEFRNLEKPGSCGGHCPQKSL